MKGTATAMRLEMSKPLTRLALCWKVVQRVGGEVNTWTDHDAPILDPVDGLVYMPIAGGSQSDVVGDVSMQAANMNVTAAAVAPNPTLDSVRAGDWDYAYVEMFYLCWADPSKGRHIIRSGTIGQVSVGLSQSNVEVRGLLNAVAQSYGDLTQPGCRHRLGDGAYLEGGCNNDGTIDPEYYSVTGVVTDISADGVDIDIDEVVEGSPPTATGIYAWGRIKALEGLNAGRSMDIKVSITGRIQLHLPFPYSLDVGTAVQVYEGCDGLRETCVARFNNVNNFDGEPFLPGTDKMVQVARS